MKNVQKKCFFNKIPFEKTVSVFSMKRKGHGKQRKQAYRGRILKESGFNVRRVDHKVYNRRGSRGQGLIEYLILVALMAVATIGIIRTLNQTVKSRFANSIYALQGRNQKAKTYNLRKEEFQRSDLSNFMTGAASSDKNKSKK